MSFVPRAGPAGGGPPWWTWLVVGAALVVALATARFVYRDARSRGLSRAQTATWLAGCAFLWVVMFPLWFVLRDEYGAAKPSG